MAREASHRATVRVVPCRQADPSPARQILTVAAPDRPQSCGGQQGKRRPGQRDGGQVTAADGILDLGDPITARMSTVRSAGVSFRGPGLHLADQGEARPR